MTAGFPVAGDLLKRFGGLGHDGYEYLTANWDNVFEGSPAI